jgi:hypothetical protein
MARPKMREKAGNRDGLLLYHGWGSRVPVPFTFESMISPSKTEHIIILIKGT